MGNGEWGMGSGEWVMGNGAIGTLGLGTLGLEKELLPMSNAQCPITHYQLPITKCYAALGYSE
ncbi:hypothetical protein [Tolypothrix sp. NIES-4075]|uniref:hypothetical protein n=1 Tax=Tolypothrix sp. NIES-4075 TaxID=2005459 RepID=UPI00117CDB35|nr:hypothetical protein [Tolypothrix sp. NIES-4075]